MIELMIGLAIFAILLMLALPNYRQFMVNAQIRNAAETVLAGARLAQLEAIKRNEPVQMIYAAGTGWQVRDVATDSLLGEGLLVGGAKQAQLTVTPAGTSRVTFTGLGRVIPQSPVDGTDAIGRVDITVAGASNPNPLAVIISGATGVKLCDPKFVLPDPMGCP
jgi:type IV fimbrial biogenesis protein FimT